jgi:pimeloyl-ACP methyl ester carboxylesterase
MRRAALATTIALAIGASGAAAIAETPRWKTLPEPAALPAAAATGDVAAGDVSLHYRTYGDGPPVVLLHGGLGSIEQFGGQIGALAAGHRVIAIDSRGHGRSTRGTSGISYRQMAEDVVAVLDHLAIDRASVVGWSDGGVVGLELAIRFPARVGRVVVLGTTYDVAGMKSAGGAATTTRYFARAAAAYKKLSPAPKQLAAFRKDLRAMWKAQPTYSEAELAAIRAPLLVLLGDHDELVRREHAEKLATVVPGARFAALADTSHFALWQDVDGFNRAVLAFLDE